MSLIQDSILNLLGLLNTPAVKLAMGKQWQQIHTDAVEEAARHAVSTWHDECLPRASVEDLLNAVLPCGHPSKCGYTHDRGANIGCRWCDEVRAVREGKAALHQPPRKAEGDGTTTETEEVCDWCQGAGEVQIILRGGAHEVAGCPKCIEHEHDCAERVVAPTKEAYAELLMAISHKYVGETRHQTALRYLREKSRTVEGTAMSMHIMQSLVDSGIFPLPAVPVPPVEERT